MKKKHVRPAAEKSLPAEFELTELEVEKLRVTELQRQNLQQTVAMAQAQLAQAQASWSAKLAARLDLQPEQIERYRFDLNTRKAKLHAEPNP